VELLSSFRLLQGLDEGRSANDFISIERNVREKEEDHTKYGRNNSDLNLGVGTV
jgi:hypothetical protein